MDWSTHDSPSLLSEGDITQHDLVDVLTIAGHSLALHNATLPVNMLPNEIFVEILRLAVTGIELDGMTWMASAMGTCRHWRELIVNTPTLWSDIELSKNLHFVELCVTRSDATNISVHLPMQPPNELPVTIDFLPALSLLAPHHRRIACLDLCLTPESTDWTANLSQSLSSTLEAALPALVSLSLTTRPGFHLRLQGNHLPSLRNLSLTSVTVEWTCLQQLSRLTSLTLNDTTHPNDCRGPLASLLDLLEACVWLESFIYERWKIFHGQAIPNDRIVSLPRMRHFYISGLPTDIIQVTSRISLPREAHLSLESFDLHTDAAPSNEFPVLWAVLPRDTTRLPVLADVRHVMVWFERYKLLVHADAHRSTFWDSYASKSSNCKVAPSAPHSPESDAPVIPSLCIVYRLSGAESDDYVLANAARELGALFPPTVETLVLRGAMDVVRTTVWARVLAAFPRMSHLELGAIECDIKTFPPALALTPGGPPCPRLRKLVLRYEPNEEDGGRQMLSELYEVLRMRDGAGCRLESLSIQVEPLGDDMLFMPSDVVSRLPPDLEEIERNLESVVGSLEIMLLIDDD